MDGRRSIPCLAHRIVRVMTDCSQDREIERNRYNTRAGHRLANAASTLGPDGAESVDTMLRKPYLAYERLIRDATRPGFTVLDV